jgi:hypothetical protein
MASLGSLTEFVASQDELVREAALTLPHEFSRCTYSLGPIRQAVYLCLTCAVPRGLCSSCSIACHTHHDQIELFPKRNFRCDCPTTAIPHGCTLHRSSEKENRENKYDHNFSSVFCRCGRPYDPKSERETMIQCLACEVRAHMTKSRQFVDCSRRIGSTSHVYTCGHDHPRDKPLLFAEPRQQPPMMMSMTANPKPPLQGCLHRSYLQRTMTPLSAPRACVRSISFAGMPVRKAL